MPYRIPFLTAAVSFVTEAALLSYLAIQNGLNLAASLISDEDWQRISGPHGVAFISVVAVIVLWVNGLRREKNEDSRRVREEVRREARHAETIVLQRENSAKLIDLTIQSIKAQGAVALELKTFRKEMEKRPCCAEQFQNEG